MLTVDTVAPRITINGGASATTRRTDPTITGTSDAAPGTTVTVSVAGNSMTTLLQTDGNWNVYAGLVGEGTRQVVATVQDPAGNLGTFSQSLTINPFTPSVCPPATIERRGLSRNQKRGIGILAVTGGGAGKVILQSSRTVRWFSRAINPSGRGWLRIQARGWAARKLKRQGQVRLKVKVTYRPRAGCPAKSIWTGVTLVRKR